MEDNYKEPSVCDDCEIGDGWNVNFVVANAMKIMASVLTLIVIRWIFNHESHVQFGKGEYVNGNGVGL